MVHHSTDETAKMHHQLLEAKWGKDGSILTAGCMEYRFDRHFMIAQGIGCMSDSSFINYTARGVAEYCGDVQQMVSIFDQQLGAMREYGKSGVLGHEHTTFWLWLANGFMGSELQALHPFGKELAALLKSYEGRCTDPNDCEGWYGSVDFSAWTARHSDGKSSKDGLHHMSLKSETISHLQAVVSICLASTGKSSIDLTWLDNLPAPDNPKLHDSLASSWRFMNTRVAIAEVLESQGRYKEALRCVSSCSPATRVCMLIRSLLFNSPATAFQSLNCKQTSTGMQRRRCEQGIFSAGAMLRWGNMRSRCRHSTQQSSWRGAGAFCYQRHC
jgi:hypothetical protein